jgi:methane/ammonia monooxygenase subunit A
MKTRSKAKSSATGIALVIKSTSRTGHLASLLAFFVVGIIACDFYARFTLGGWHNWIDEKDYLVWPTATPISLIGMPAIAQYYLWDNFRFPTGATVAVLGLICGEWIDQYFNLWSRDYYPINLIWPPILVPGAILIDTVLLYTGSYIITAVVGSMLWGLVFYPCNWVILGQFHQPVEYNGLLMSLADIQAYHYPRDVYHFPYAVAVEEMSFEKRWRVVIGFLIGVIGGGISSWVLLRKAFKIHQNMIQKVSLYFCGFAMMFETLIFAWWVLS